MDWFIFQYWEGLCLKSYIRRAVLGYSERWSCWMIMRHMLEFDENTFMK